MAEAVTTTATSVLTLLGVDADPVQSREHILLSAMLNDAWCKGENLDLAAIIHRIQQPPFTRVGVLDLEAFFPEKDRFALAMRVNGLLAAPSFALWLEGEPLDIATMLYTPEGKPRVAIVSVAHLSDQERMFFLTLLLNRVVSWMRAQSGTSSLRAMLYLDEVAGYMPPVANPPSKQALLLLMKQARAFGLGVVLATQNPIDIDYKGLSNAGTWFLGRLQTERDKARLLDGLEGALQGQGATFDRGETERILSSLQKRTFFLHNVHEDRPGDLPDALGDVVPARAADEGSDQAAVAGGAAAQRPSRLRRTRRGRLRRRRQPRRRCRSARPTARRPAAIRSRRRRRCCRRRSSSSSRRRSASCGAARVRADAVRQGVGAVRRRQARRRRRARRGQAGAVRLGRRARRLGVRRGHRHRRRRSRDGAGGPGDVRAAADGGGQGDELRAPGMKDFARWLQQEQVLSIFFDAATELCSRPDETEAAFRARVALRDRETRDAAKERLRQKYASKIGTLTERIRRAEQAKPGAGAAGVRRQAADRHLGARHHRRRALRPQDDQRRHARQGDHRGPRHGPHHARVGRRDARQETLGTYKAQLQEIEHDIEAEVAGLEAGAASPTRPFTAMESGRRRPTSSPSASSSSGARPDTFWRTGMAVLNVKNLPDGLYRKLRARARRERRSIAQEVTHLLSKALETPNALSILELEGLGREHWRDVDATLHVRAERDSWD